MPKAIVRKSGNSTVLVIPPDVIKTEHIKIGESVEFQVFRKTNLKKLFGIARGAAISGQKAKDELRREW